MNNIKIEDIFPTIEQQITEGTYLTKEEQISYATSLESMGQIDITYISDLYASHVKRLYRGFKLISTDQATSDHITDDEYSKIKLPVRATKQSAGYDFYAPRTYAIAPGDKAKIPTGVRAYMQSDEVLTIHIRSSLGFKKGIRLANCTGIIDSDYYNAANEGHIWVALHNDSDEHVTIWAGDAFAQGIFNKFLIADDDEVTTERVGGMGSTNV